MIMIYDYDSFPFIEVHTQLVDAHLYFVNKSALDVLSESRSVVQLHVQTQGPSSVVKVLL